MGYGVAMSTHGYTHLTDTDRETLSLDLTHGQSLRMMAKVLGRAPSTVSRELVQPHARPPLPRLHRTDTGSRSSLSATAITQTPGSLAVAAGVNLAGGGLLT